MSPGEPPMPLRCTLTPRTYNPIALESDACRRSNRLWNRTLFRYTRAGLRGCVVSTISVPLPQTIQDSSQTNDIHPAQDRNWNLYFVLNNRIRGATVQLEFVYLWRLFLVLFLHFRRKTRLIKWASVCVCVCVCVCLCVCMCVCVCVCVCLCTVLIPP